MSLPFNSQDLLSLIVCTVYIFVVSYSWYFALVALWGKGTAARFAIPVSMSLTMLIGYFFYLIEHVNVFPLAYLGIILVVNGAALYWLHRNQRLPTLSFSSTWWVAILLWLIVAYSRYYYAITSAAPGATDTLAHVEFIRQLLVSGHLDLAYYAPGFHLLLYPLAKYLPQIEQYRFIGPAIGLVTAIAYLEVLRPWLRKPVAIWAFIGLLAFPVFNPFISQNISFWPSALSFALFAGLISLTLDIQAMRRWWGIILYLIITLGLAICVPYTFVFYLPILVIFAFIALLLAKRWPTLPLRSWVVTILLTCIGLLAAFAHVVVQNDRHSTASGLPEVTFKQETADGQVQVVTNQQLAQQIGARITSSHPNLAHRLGKSAFIQKYVLPGISTFEELITPKGVRPIWLSGAQPTYLWLLMAIVVFIPIAIWQRQREFFYLSLLSLLYGISTQTGLLEMGDYRGRSSWYFMLLVLFTVGVIAEALYRNVYNKMIVPALVFLVVSAALWPPIFFYASYSPEIYNVIHQVMNKNPDGKIVIGSNHDLTVISPHILTVPAEPNSGLAIQKADRAMVVVEKQPYSALPERYQQTLQTNVGGSQAANGEVVEFQRAYTEESSLLGSVDGQFSLYFDDPYISIYGKGIR